MAKSSKTREVSIHSRAARRNVSPPPQSNKNKDKAEKENEHWMYSAQNSGVHKKSKAKQLTRQQKARQAKALEKADRNADVLETKIAESKQKGRVIQARAKDWDELNGVQAQHEKSEKEKTLQEPEMDDEQEEDEIFQYDQPDQEIDAVAELQQELQDAQHNQQGAAKSSLTLDQTPLLADSKHADQDGLEDIT